MLVRRHFGVVAGLVAALALAVSPISVVTDRNNTIDGTLALVLLLAAWAMIHAAESGKLRWLLLSGFLVGLGFNVKMSEAYLLVPALGLTYLLCAPRKLVIRLAHLALALVVMLVVSLSWAAVVDMTPASQRPYVGSTQNNSELSLAFGYNGLNRLRIGGSNNGGGNTQSHQTTERNPNTKSNKSGASSLSKGNATITPRSSSSSGTPAFALSGAFNPVRLFTSAYGGQIAWLLPFALLSFIALALQRRFDFRHDRRLLGLLLWGFWLLTMTTFFTLDASFHQYYMTVMAPGLCAMVGIGVVVMWQDFRHASKRGWLLLVALALTAVGQIYILSAFPGWSSILSPLIAVVTILVIIVLLIARIWSRPELTQMAAGALVCGLLVLLIAPTIWSTCSVLLNTESSAPIAGPSSRNEFAAFKSVSNASTASSAANQLHTEDIVTGGLPTTVEATLIKYLERHQGSTKFLLATPSSGNADAIILNTNLPVMAMGGFSGNDPILTTSDLQTLIANNTVRYFLMNAPSRTTRKAVDDAIDRLPEQDRAYLAGNASGAGGFFNANRQNTIASWISAHCKVVPTSSWQGTKRTTKTTTTTNLRLYDCAGAVQ
jgi:4-amino-4-deoxy-L-arabinose transferase-like glycosyltransferase